MKLAQLNCSTQRKFVTKQQKISPNTKAQSRDGSIIKPKLMSLGLQIYSYVGTRPMRIKGGMKNLINSRLVPFKFLRFQEIMPFSLRPSLERMSYCLLMGITSSIISLLELSKLIPLYIVVHSQSRSFTFSFFFLLRFCSLSRLSFLLRLFSDPDVVIVLGLPKWPNFLHTPFVPWISLHQLP